MFFNSGGKTAQPLLKIRRNFLQQFPESKKKNMEGVKGSVGSV